ncbi:MAG: hypothetical protein P1P82_10490 [Bacteroidales bacterium]|nr:hypothetical protein [Bacteroidales bacterium]
MNSISLHRDQFMRCKSSIIPLFRKNLKYAESHSPNHIFILSAKHGLVKLDDEIEPYDNTLNKMNASEKKEWAALAITKLKKIVDILQDRFTLLAGNNYRKHHIN